MSALPFVELSAIIGEPDAQRPGNDIVTLHLQLNAQRRARDLADVELEVMTFCRENMAPYKVPKRIFFHEALPLTPVGKLDKKALRG